MIQISKKQKRILICGIIIFAIIIMLISGKKGNKKPSNEIKNNEEYTEQQADGNKVNTSKMIEKWNASG